MRRTLSRSRTDSPELKQKSEQSGTGIVVVDARELSDVILEVFFYRSCSMRKISSKCLLGNFSPEITQKAFVVAPERLMSWPTLYFAFLSIQNRHSLMTGRHSGF